MGKLIKVVIMLAIVGGGIALVMHYTSGTGDSDQQVTKSDDQKAKSEGIQPQEKYGFAPAGE